VIYLLGNPTLDRITVGTKTVVRPGGTVLYAGLFLAGMDCPVAVVGKGSRRHKRYMEQSGIDTRHFRIAEPVTRFDNRYARGLCRQRAQAGAGIAMDEISQEVFTGRAILAGPVLGELRPDVLTAPRKAPLLVDMQGFLRHIDRQGRVYLKPGSSAETALRHADIVKLNRSEAEAVLGPIDDFRRAADDLHAYGAACVLITCGGRGAFLSDRSGCLRLPAVAVEVVDSTGAGDVFAAAFLLGYLQSRGDLAESGRFAAVAAALSTRAFGPDAIPGRQSIVECLVP